MSQRTRARTTAAARKPTKLAPPEESAAEPTQRKSGRKSARPTAAPSESAPGANIGADLPPTAETTEALEPLSPDALARLLRAIATELERDPALARRLAIAMNGTSGVDAGDATVSASSASRTESHGAVPETEPVAMIGRTFHPTIVTGVAPDLGKGIPDPFVLRDRLGVDGLRETLESLRLGSLRAIIREHHLDPSGRLSAQNDATKLRERIIRAAMKDAHGA